MTQIKFWKTLNHRNDILKSFSMINNFITGGSIYTETKLLKLVDYQTPIYPSNRALNPNFRGPIPRLDLLLVRSVGGASLLLRGPEK